MVGCERSFRFATHSGCARIGSVEAGLGVDDNAGDGFVDDVFDAVADGVGQTGSPGRPRSRWRTSRTPAGMAGSAKCRLAAARRPSCASAPGMRTSVALLTPRAQSGGPNPDKVG
jgi:hypothetical protein